MLATPASWQHLEKGTGVKIRNSLLAAVNRLVASGNSLVAAKRHNNSKDDLRRQRTQLDAFRKLYLRTEITVDLYIDALNTRGHEKFGQLLSAYDSLARKSMQSLLSSLGHETPPVLTYIDNGRGASIAKAGMRLWDGGTINPCAVIKVVLHNLYRNTSLLHEAGHQVAHITGWNDELASVLRHGLAPHSTELAEVWSSWSSEIAADAYAFVHTGYASVAGLHDVVSGDSRSAFRYVPGDPHPISYLRVLLGVRMCRQYFGDGPWDDMGMAWIERNSLSHANRDTRGIVMASLPLVDTVAELTLKNSMQSFGRHSLEYWINPKNVHPQRLRDLVARQGESIFNSRHWLEKDPIRLLAISALDSSSRTHRNSGRQEKWLLKLGTMTIPASRQVNTTGV